MGLKKWGMMVMLLAILVAPMLACGFPLPAGTQTLAVSKAACPASEAAETCEARRDAYQLMSKLQSAHVADMSMSLHVDDGSSLTDMAVSGSYDYEVSDAPAGLGANVSATLDQGTINSEGQTQDLSGTQFILIGDTGYSTTDHGETWQYEQLDESALSGLGLLLGAAGAAGASLDLFSEPSAFAVTIGDPVEVDGQQMQVQTLTLDLTALLTNPEALSSLFESSMAAGGETLGMSAEDIGDPNQFIPLAGMFIPFLAGSEFSTTLYIGQDDGYIHRVEDNYVLKMDLSAMDPESSPIEMTYTLEGNITGHNSGITIAAPENATEGGGLLGEEGGLFGGGLGSSLFGN